MVGTLDEAAGSAGVLIVSGGSEIRCGAHRGMAMLAAKLAGLGIATFRFDRRGIGDSDGENHGYASSAPDIAAALAAFQREQPHVTRVIGFGNCDGATALLLLDRGCDALVLANPWLGDEDAPPPPAALRRHYLRRLGSPAAWRAFLSNNKVTMLKGLADALATPRQQPLAEQVTAELARRPTTIVLAAGDRTAQVFAGSVRLPAGVKLVRIDTASHSFAGQGHALATALLTAVCERNAT
jgi:exosortase A-associated hydrolase 1